MGVFSLGFIIEEQNTPEKVQMSNCKIKMCASACPLGINYILYTSIGPWLKLSLVFAKPY
jgi:hypothetical protein